MNGVAFFFQGTLGKQKAGGTNLSPVVRGLGPPGEFTGESFARRFEAFGAEGGGVAGALFLIQVVVEPVVADGDGSGHFCGVEKVLGIPVLQGACGIEFENGTGEVFFVAAESPRHRGMENVTEGMSALREEAFTIGDIVSADGKSDGVVGAPEKFLVEFTCQRIGLDPFFDSRFIGLGEKNPGVLIGLGRNLPMRRGNACEAGTKGNCVRCATCDDRRFHRCERALFANGLR